MAGHRIDVHHHFYPPDLKDVLGGGPTRDWVPQSSVDEMDNNEIASVALSASSIPTAWWRNDESWLRRTVRRFNERAGRRGARRPRRRGPRSCRIRASSPPPPRWRWIAAVVPGVRRYVSRW